MCGVHVEKVYCSDYCIVTLTMKISSSVKKNPLLDHFFNTRDVHRHGSSIPRTILYYTKLLISVHSPVKNHSRDTELLRNRNILLFLFVQVDYDFTLKNAFVLLRFEPVAMQQCRKEINESLVASNRFSMTVIRKEQHNLRTHFETLCKRLGLMIECVEPVTRRGCGDQAAIMMLRFITCDTPAVVAKATAAVEVPSVVRELFGFGPDKESSTVATTTAGTTTLQLDVCPFSAEPLIIDSEFSYCRPSSVGDCPVGFLCDQSFVLNRSICCRDLKSGKNGILPHRPAPTYSSTSRPSFSWNTITPTQSSPKWSALVSTTKKAPWYIKDRNTWPAVYNRITPETTESEKELPTTIKYTTTTQAITTTTSPSTTEEPTTTKAINPWGHLWTTTALPRNVVNVSILQAGSMRPLRSNLRIFANKKQTSYSGSFEFWAPGTDEFFEGVLSCCLFAKNLLWQEAVEMLRKVVVGRR
uniref:Uncharacterized protein n=1 Tax=Heterorhabditis bacteriophora TaxID=37862 RepID=A0A1I7WRK1_HETBA